MSKKIIVFINYSNIGFLINNANPVSFNHSSVRTTKYPYMWVDITSLKYVKSQILRIEEACAQVLRQHREKCGLSQHELAYEAGISKNNTSLYETAERMPTIPTLFLIARTLKVTPHSLIAEIAALEPEI